jgi:hypothetical protein
MANKALATRQKMRLRVEPTSQVGKPRNPFPAPARNRAAGAPAMPGATGPAAGRGPGKVKPGSGDKS